jgi:glycerol kinase
MNQSFLFNLLKTSCCIFCTIFNNQRLKAFSGYEFDTNQISPKLIYQLNELKNKFGADELNHVLFGTIETWIIWNLSEEKNFVSEVTCACCTGFYDMFKVI